jgi:hypothetical protein
MLESELFLSAKYINQIEELFSFSLLLTPTEINQKLEIFNKKNSNEILLKVSKEVEESENFSLFENNIFSRLIIFNGYRYNLSLTIVGDIPIDIEKFFEQTSSIIEKKIFIADESNYEYEVGNNGFGVWVLDAVGSILYKNSHANIILRNTQYNQSGYRPQICCVDEKFFLIIPEPNYNNNTFFFYSFLISEDIIQKCTENTLKKLSLEASILAHDLRNPLTAIKLGAELLNMEDSTSDIANEILKSVDLCHEVIKVFLEFYKKEPSNKLEKFEIDKNFYRVKKMLGNRGESIDFIIDDDVVLNGIGNESLLIITFYILLNEIVSAELHRQQVYGGETEKVLIKISQENKEKCFIITGKNFSYFIKKISSDSNQLVFFKSLFKLNKLSFKIEHNELQVGTH